uniref:Uncharacterized protein n=1 Tax=Arundo donax TaxID=35708 RepID=A0A0A9DAD2_ARUDO
MKYLGEQGNSIRCLKNVLMTKKFGWPSLNFRTKLPVPSHKKQLVCKLLKERLAYWRRLWSLIQITRNCCFAF